MADICERYKNIPSGWKNKRKAYNSAHGDGGTDNHLIKVADPIFVRKTSALAGGKISQINYLWGN
jgi:hypothetical protein